MPQTIDFIDKIARNKNRDVLLLIFKNIKHNISSEDDDFPIFAAVDWEKHKSRNKIIGWLDTNQISWKPCAGVASPDAMQPYQGQIYLDVPYDDSLESYKLLASFLENEDGSMRWPGVEFCILPLATAMENAHHDEPGFWEQVSNNL